MPLWQFYANMEVEVVLTIVKVARNLIAILLTQSRELIITLQHRMFCQRQVFIYEDKVHFLIYDFYRNFELEKISFMKCGSFF